VLIHLLGDLEAAQQEVGVAGLVARVLVDQPEVLVLGLDLVKQHDLRRVLRVYLRGQEDGGNCTGERHVLSVAGSTTRERSRVPQATPTSNG
jgi:hypothetical protein